MRKILALALVFSLSGSSALAQVLHSGRQPTTPPLQHSARAAAANLASAQAAQPADDAYRPGGMSLAYFWTSIGLMSAGGVYLATGAVVKGYDDSDVCDDFEDDFDLDCGGIGTGVMIVGAGLIGAGVLVWVVGKNKARAAGNPQIVATPRGFAVRGRIGF